MSDLHRYAAGDELILGNRGETEFGWSQTYYKDMWDRINFAYLQTLSGKNEQWREMLETLLKKHFKCDIITWMITDEYEGGKNEHGDVVWAYIDHQSAAYEGENTEIFDSENELERFLFCTDSYIRGDNDN